ncbi:MAG: hypothetical protein NTY39_03435 [Campylobacterales bacterium]|nr:hypothetical protein [Campylobacterales bacterium]
MDNVSFSQTQLDTIISAINSRAKVKPPEPYGFFGWSGLIPLDGSPISSGFTFISGNIPLDIDSIILPSGYVYDIEFRMCPYFFDDGICNYSVSVGSFTSDFFVSVPFFTAGYTEPQNVGGRFFTPLLSSPSPLSFSFLNHINADRLNSCDIIVRAINA